MYGEPSGADRLRGLIGLPKRKRRELRDNYDVRLPARIEADSNTIVGGKHLVTQAGSQFKIVTGEFLPIVHDHVLEALDEDKFSLLGKKAQVSSPEVRPLGRIGKDAIENIIISAPVAMGDLGTRHPYLAHMATAERQSERGINYSDIRLAGRIPGAHQLERSRFP